MAPISGHDQHFDLVVIGSGSAGDSAAWIARSYGQTVAVIEKDKVGGDCPNYACVPTKALLRSAKVYSLMKRAESFGLHAEAISFDWEKIVAREEWIIRHTGSAQAEKTYQKNGIALFRGTASFEDAHHVRVNGQVLSAGKVMIATGSKPGVPQIEGVDSVQPITHRQAISLKGLPESMMIIGGGPVGCEFAQLFSTFGVKVTLLQRRKTLLPRNDEELSAIVRQALEDNGVTVATGVSVQGLAQERGRKVAVTTMGGGSSRCSRPRRSCLLLAGSRRLAS